MGAYHVTPHESIGMTLYLLMLGRETKLLIEMILGYGCTSTGKLVTLYGKYINILRDQMQRAHDVAEKYLGRNVVRMKESYDTKHSLIQYKPGELVRYGTESGQLDVIPNLRVNFQGHYLFLHKIEDLDYWVQLDARGQCEDCTP